jgi:hypothetical protein
MRLAVCTRLYLLHLHAHSQGAARHVELEQLAITLHPHDDVLAALSGTSGIPEINPTEDASIGIVDHHITCLQTGLLRR